jgi:hypothetical protein
MKTPTTLNLSKVELQSTNRPSGNNGARGVAPVAVKKGRYQLHVKAGGLKFNHNPAQVRGLKVKLQVRAGGLRVNHNEAKLQANNGIKSGNIKQQKAVG